MTQELFSSFYEHSFNHAHGFWQINDDLATPGFAVGVIYHLETELEHTYGDLDLMIVRTTALVNDVIAFKAAHPEHTVIADYLQFTASAMLLHFLARNKYFPLCYDWLCNSVADEVSTEIERNFDLNRLTSFTTSADATIVETRDQMMGEWLHDLFYYSRNTGGAKEIAEHCINSLLTWVFIRARATLSLEYVTALCQMSTWCINFRYRLQDLRIQTILQGLYGISQDRKVKKNIAFHFSCLPINHTTVSRHEWTALVLNNYPDLLYPHERFQIIVNQYEDSLPDLEANFERLLEAIRVYNTGLQRFNGTLFNHIESSIFTILTRTLATLVTNGRITMANSLIGVYFGVPEDQLIATENLFIVPGWDQGVLFAREGLANVFNGDANALLTEITELRNAFLRTTITRNDNLEFSPVAPERHGEPARDDAAAFETCLLNMLHLDDDELWNTIGQYNGYYLWFGIQLPIQSIISLARGVTLPLIHSFQRPLPARPIRRIFIWKGFTQMSDFERMGIQEMFTHCEVVWCDCFESDKETFLRHYADPEYDAIWILGHGEFIHESAHESFLDLGEGITVTIEELTQVTLTHTDRRLLVIDACDGASSSLVNSPASIGIGVSVASRSQSVMSHNWPVENPPSLVMGLLLGSYLSQGATYTEAHHQSVVMFRQGKAAVLAHLRQFIRDEEVLERIQNNEFEYDNFIYWGSLSYII